MIAGAAQFARYLPQFLEMPDLGWSPCRGRARPDPTFHDEVENICQYWRSITTSQFKQDVSVLIEGQKGKGKSYTSVALAINTAKWISQFLGSDWRDHFDMERTVAIVSPDAANEVMANTQKYDCRIFDDISIGWGARNWQSEENKDKNDIFLINRIDNTCNILSTPNSKLIDVVPRSNVNFKGEMDTPYFKFGYTSLKIFEPIPMFRSQSYKVMDPYLRAGRDKYVLYFVERPSKRYTDEYDKIRREMTDMIKRERHNSLMGIEPNKPARPVKASHPKTQEMIERITKLSEDYHKDVRVSGDTGKQSFRQYAIEKGISSSTVGKWIEQKLITKEGELGKNSK